MVAALRVPRVSLAAPQSRAQVPRLQPQQQQQQQQRCSMFQQQPPPQQQQQEEVGKVYHLVGSRR
jgi:hypothetical protein